MKVLVNLFAPLVKQYAKYCKGLNFEYRFTKKRMHYNFILDYFEMKRSLKRGELDKYDVIHINNWFNAPLIRFRRRKDQVWIFESHGPHVGLEKESMLKAIPFNRKILAYLMLFFLEKRYIESMRLYDIYYISVPAHVEAARKVRKDFIWLPNPVDLDTYKKSKKKIRMEGKPALFFPTRIHGFKDPLFAAKIFQRIRKEFPGAKMHLIRDDTSNPLWIEFLSRLGNGNYKIHDFMKLKEYVAFMSSADLVLGQFKVGNGLNELHAMACQAPLVTFDDKEIIKVKKEDLPDYALRLLKEPSFRMHEIKRNYDFVRRMHNPRDIAKRYEENIYSAMRRIKGKI